jgi:hypothetical protein
MVQKSFAIVGLLALIFLFGANQTQLLNQTPDQLYFCVNIVIGAILALTAFSMNNFTSIIVTVALTLLGNVLHVIKDHADITPLIGEGLHTGSYAIPIMHAYIIIALLQRASKEKAHRAKHAPTPAK